MATVRSNGRSAIRYDDGAMGIRDLEALLEAERDGAALDLRFFWGHQARAGEITAACFSQWWPCRFVVDGVAYPSAEHFMMASKARLFGDEESAAKILAAPDPAKAKALGRAVRGFDQARWVAERFGLVTRGNVAKFGQNDELRRFLVATGEAILVEASPTDTVWGIGLAADSPDARLPSRWRGSNLLGFALMAARAELRG
jgi:ribA/ribD-fused uncharacterized protein